MSTTQHQDEMVISSYSLAEAEQDGVLHKLWPHRWDKITHGKPLMVTAAIKADLSDAGLMEIWNAYVTWRREECPKLPPEDQLFWIRMSGETVWVIEDLQAFTILYPSDY